MLRPTIFGSFPGFFSKIYYRIIENIEARNHILAAFMNQAIQNKIFTYMETGEF